MIFIDIDDLELPNGWQKRANAALDELKAIVDIDEKKKFINSNSSIWSDLKVHLEELSNSKCWYCECKDIGSDNKRNISI